MKSTQPHFETLLKYGAAALLTSCFAAFLWTAFTVYWTGSELYPSLTARYMFSEEGAGRLFSLKPLFNFLLFVCFHIAAALDTHPVSLNRIVFAFNGAALALLLYLIVKQKTTAFNGLAAVLIFISSHIFLTRGFRVRSDLLVSALGFFAVFLSMKTDFGKPASTFRKQLIFALLICMLLISPKAAYWLFSIGPALKDTFFKTKQKSSGVLTTAIGAGAFLLCLSFVLRDPLFIKALRGSAVFYVHNIQDALFSENRLSNIWRSEISFLPRFVLKNPQIIALTLLKAGFVLYQTVFSKQRIWNAFDTSFAGFLLVLLFHPQGKPFFFCALTPWFILYFFTDPLFIKQTGRFSSKFKQIVLMLLFVYTSGALAFNGARAFEIYNNFEQKRLIHQMNRFFQKFPSLRIYDTQAFLVHPQSRHWFSGSYSAYDLPLKKLIANHKIDVILLSPQTAGKVLSSIQTAKGLRFTEIQSGVYYRSFQIPVSLLKNKGGKFPPGLMEEQVSSRFERKNRLFWHIFLDKRGAPLPEKKMKAPCAALDNLSSVKKNLSPFCVYTARDFMEGEMTSIPKEAEFAAVFYIPPPPAAPGALSVRNLLTYDLLF